MNRDMLSSVSGKEFLRSRRITVRTEAIFSDGFAEDLQHPPTSRKRPAHNESQKFLFSQMFLALAKLGKCVSRLIGDQCSKVRTLESMDGLKRRQACSTPCGYTPRGSQNNKCDSAWLNLLASLILRRRFVESSKRRTAEEYL
jgi:hypothetical protein